MAGQNYGRATPRSETRRGCITETGDGPLGVLLHGFPEFWYGWRLQIAPLAAAGFRVVAPDLRGYNLSSKPDGVAAYTAGKLAADVAHSTPEAARGPPR